MSEIKNIKVRVCKNVHPANSSVPSNEVDVMDGVR
jgi:hypothetical protein